MARGLKLNYPEAVFYLSAAILEGVVLKGGMFAAAVMGDPDADAPSSARDGGTLTLSFQDRQR